MKKGGGKNKGSSFEREISKKLSLWFSEGEKDDIFWRSTSSGARATTRKKSGLGTAASYGDITAISPEGEALLRIVTIELKRYKTIDILELLDSKSKKKRFEEFWGQTCQSANDAFSAGWGIYPVLIMQRDRKEPVIVLSSELVSSLKEWAGEYDFTSKIIIEDSIRLTKTIIRLSEFLNWISPEYFKMRWRQGK